MYQIGWFSTGRDKAARDLLNAAMTAIDSGEIKARISFVFCSREPGESKESDLFIDKVRSYRIPLEYFSYQKYKSTHEKDNAQTTKGFVEWRLDYDRQVMSSVNKYNADLYVLAGYMLIVGYEMCRKYNMINLHPAAPGGPTGSWQEVVWQLMTEGASESGVMMHLVTPELDRGPVATYCTFSIKGASSEDKWWQLKDKDISQVKSEQGETNPLFKLIRKEGLKREFPLIIATLKAFSSGRIKVDSGEIVDSSCRIIEGYNLTNEVEKQINRKK